MSALQIIWAIARKDLLSEFRSREVVVSIAAFALLVIALFALSLDLSTTFRRAVGPGVLWAAVAFAGVTGLSRAFAHETENDTLEGLLLAPVSRDLVLLGKSVGIFLFMSLALAVILPVFAALFNVVVFRPELLAISVLAVIGFSIIGTLFAAMSARVRAREVMLPMLFLPVVAPLLMAAIEVTAGVVGGRSWTEANEWLGLAAVYDLVFFFVAITLFQFTVED